MRQHMRAEQAHRVLGTTIAGRYTVEALLGEGGMGAVFRARRLSDHAVVALKWVWQEAEDSLLSRFLREARLSSQIRHPHVVQVLDFGRWNVQRDSYYIVTELIEGPSLERLLGATALLPAEAAELCGQLLEALAHLHARGILHRDVKPENILISRREEGWLHLHVTDFGIAALMEGEGSERLTQQGESLGTPLYMAPEQGMGEVLAGPGLDLYAVGVILYRILTGRHPFEGRALEIMLAKVTHEATWPEESTAVSPALRGVVMRLLERRPESRYAVAGDVLAALQPFRAPVVWSVERWSELSGGAAVRGAPAGAPAAPALSREVSLWGRAAELETLNALARDACGGAPRLVLLEGGAGVGKSALARHLALELAESGRAQPVFAAHMRGAGPWDGLRVALDQLLGTAGRGAVVVAALAQEWLRRHGEVDAQESAEMVAFLRPGHLDVEASEREVHCASLIVRLLRRMGKQRPVVLVLDDLHAAGAALLSFLELVLLEASLEPWPLLVLATWTQELGEEAAVIKRQRLARFEGGLLKTLSVAVLPVETLAQALEARGMAPARARRIAHRARGNPLFAEHLMMSDTTAASTAAPSSSADPGLSAEQLCAVGEIPASLRAILEASLEVQLARTPRPAQAREWLSWAAVLGEEFEGALLQAVARELPGGAQLEEDLEALLDVGLLSESRGAVDVLLFSQGLLRETLLEGLGARRARRMHRKVAEALESWKTAEHRAAMAGLLGQHWHAAGSTEQAVEAWLQAMHSELRTGDAAAAVRWGTLALELMTLEDPRRAATVIQLGRLRVEMGDAAVAARLLEPLTGGADAEHALIAGEVLAELYENLGDRARWQVLLAHMEARLHEASARGHRAWWRARALWCNTCGEFQEGYLAAKLGWEGAPPGEERVRGASRFAFSRLLMGFHGLAEELVNEVLQDPGLRMDLRIRVLRTKGLILSIGGRPAESRQVHSQVYELARRTGRLSRIPVYHIDVSSVFHLAGELPSARIHAVEGARTAQALGERWAELFGRFQCAVYDLAEGSLVSQAEQLDALEVSAASLQDKMITEGIALMRAWIAARRGDVAHALALTSRRRVLLDLPSLPMVPQLYEEVGRLYAAHQGELSAESAAEGRRWLEAAAVCWRRCGGVAQSEAAEALLALRSPPWGAA